MKKIFKILAFTLLFILVVIVVLPFVFQGKIVRVVKEQINKSVNARVDFNDASLSLIRSFPDFSLRLKQLSVIGNQPFENDTLVYIEMLKITLDLQSVFRGSPYEIKKIELNTPVLNLLTLKDGSINWDIAKPEEETLATEEEMAQEENPLFLNVKDLLIKSGKVLYDDKDMDFSILIKGLDGNINGSLSTGLSNLIIEAKVKDLEIIYEGIAYLSGIKANYKGEFELDLDKDYYTMRNNHLKLNDLGVDVDGGFGFIGDDITMNLIFKSRDESFKNLLSLVPGIYTREFEKLKTSGIFSLSGFVKGLYGDVAMPGFGFELGVDNANISYPDLPESIRDIYVKAKIENKTGEMDDTKVDIDKFDFTLANNPMKSRFYLKTPITDPDMDAFFAGKIDFASLAEALPLEPNEALTGLLEFDARFTGKMSDIENARYDNVLANGFLSVKSMNYRSSAINLPIEIHTAKFDFSPAFLNLENTDLAIGGSRMQISGKVENYLAYYMGNGYLKGNLILFSDILNLNELMAAIPADTLEVSDKPETATQVPDLPERIDFAIKAKAGKILYENYELSNATASIIYKDKVVRFDPLNAAMLAGNVEMKGLFDATDKSSPYIDFDFRISNFNIAQAYSSINMFKQVAPVAEKTKGSFSTGFKLKGKLDQEFNPSYETLQGGGTLQTSQLLIESVKVMEQLANLLGNEDYKRLVTDGIDFSFEILNGKVFQKPFTVKYGGTNTTIGGNVGFDKQINYDLAFQIPYEKLGAGQAIRNLTEEASKKGFNISAGSNLNVNVKLTGLVTSPEIELDYKAAAGSLKSEIEDAARKELQKQKEEALKKVSEEADKILSDARSKSEQLIAQAGQAAANIRAEAASAAESIRKEAENQAKKIETEGKKKGMVAEMAAKESARKVRKEGDNTAQKITKEADKKAEEMVNQAKAQADEIMRKAQEQVERL